MNISDQAVEAAAIAVAGVTPEVWAQGSPEVRSGIMSDARKALEAAAPHMAQAASSDWERCPKRHAGLVQHLLDCESDK